MRNQNTTIHNRNLNLARSTKHIATVSSTVAFQVSTPPPLLLTTSFLCCSAPPLNSVLPLLTLFYFLFTFITRSSHSPIRSSSPSVFNFTSSSLDLRRQTVVTHTHTHTVFLKHMKIYQRSVCACVCVSWGGEREEDMAQVAQRWRGITETPECVNVCVCVNMGWCREAEWAVSMVTDTAAVEMKRERRV